MVELKKLLIGGLAATAMLADGAHAATKYSEMTANPLTVQTTIDGTLCAAGTALQAQGGLSSINVAWSGASTTSGNTMMVKLCYDASELGSKPWRKKKDVVNKNKRCKQTVVEADYLKTGITGAASGNVDIPLPLNTAPAKYFIEVLESGASGYERYGDDSCSFTVVTYDRLPSGLVGTMSFFIAFSIIVATAGTMYDYKKQNAAAAQYA